MVAEVRDRAFLYEELKYIKEARMHMNHAVNRNYVAEGLGVNGIPGGRFYIPL